MHGCVTPWSVTESLPVCLGPPNELTVSRDGYGVAAPWVPIAGMAIGGGLVSARPSGAAAIRHTAAMAARLENARRTECMNTSQGLYTRPLEASRKPPEKP